MDVRGRAFVYLEPALVARASYSGRNIVAPNSRDEHRDHRGYQTVERWVASVVEARNAEPVAGEGLSRVRGGPLLAHVAADLLGASTARRWPLIKVLDIGGAPVLGPGGNLEAPPIPCHVHAGKCGTDGRLCGEGKLEAYHYPPPPAPLGPIVTRLGLKPGTRREQLLLALDAWGTTDALYALCNEFAVCEGDGWIIRPRVVHAPAPWPTLEVQLPQDDFNMLACKLGQRLGDQAELTRQRAALLLKGLPDARAVLEQAVDLELSADENFERRWKRVRQPLDADGRRWRTFFDEFDGQSLQLAPHESSVLCDDGRPYAALVWRGSARVEPDGHVLDTSAEHSEILVLPHQQSLTLTAGPDGILVYLFFAMADN